MKRWFLFLCIALFLSFFSFTSAEYSIEIWTDTIHANFTANGVNAYEISPGIWKVNATNGNYEIDRALVMKTLFYGTGGGDPRATLDYMTIPSHAFTNETRDIGKKGGYASISNGITGGSRSGTYTGTYSDTSTNLDLSVWSKIILSGANANSWVTGSYSNSRSSSGTTDETGTDLSSEQQDNPATNILSYNLASVETSTINGFFLTKGNISWVLSGTGSPTYSNTDFFYNHSFPLFEDSPITINAPLDGATNLLGNNLIFNISLEDIVEEWTNISLYLNGSLNETLLISGSSNTSIFQKSFSNVGLYNWSVIACTNETICTQSETRDFEVLSYNINSLNYTSTVLEGDIEDFSLNLSLADSITISNADFFYNGTEYPLSITTSSNLAILNSTIQIPNFATDVNTTFYFNITLSDGTIFTSGETQQVISLKLDDCSTYTYPILNISLFDEQSKDSLNGSIELIYEVLNSDYESIQIYNFSAEYITNTSICSEINFTNQGLYYSTEIRYYADDYASELYNIQRSPINSDNQFVSLYDLNSSSATQFKITYQDSYFNFVEGAIIQLQRKYISENIFEVVEAPLTSADGIALVSIDLDSIKYRATVVKNGVVLDEFDNLVFKCQSELTGECNYQLLGTINPQNDVSIVNLLDFYYSEPVLSNGSIIVSFSIPSGTPANINLVLEQKDEFGNQTLCNNTITSSAGSIQCTYSTTLGDSYIDLKLYKNGVPMAIKTYVINSNKNLDWLGNNYVFIVILLFSLVGMALSSPEWIVINGVVTLVISGGLFLANGLEFVMGLGSLVWLVIAVIILISKMAKQEDR